MTETADEDADGEMDIWTLAEQGPHLPKAHAATQTPSRRTPSRQKRMLLPLCRTGA
jgi:hypothetical protein